MNKETIEIKKDSVIEVYNTARNTNDYGTLHALETLFGIDFFKPKDVRERINSVWHDIDNELPECGKHVVNEDWFDFIADDEKDMERILKQYPFKHWAYIDDLLPDRKEDR